MPETTYMGVDDRRDHSFKIPRPDLSIQFNTPNVCTQCHKEKQNKWAQKALSDWHGEPPAISLNRQNLYRLNLYRSNQGEPLALQAHLAIVADQQIDVISRASALSLLSYAGFEISSAMLRPYLSHKQDLIRLAAADVAALLSADQKVKELKALLADPLRAVRVAAARSLLDANTATLDTEVRDTEIFNRAFQELQLSNKISSWRGEGRLNQSTSELATKQLLAAEKSLIAAIEIEPFFEAGYINLADLYRSQSQPLKVKQVLLQGIEKLPKAAALNYAYGLYLVRQKKYLKSISYFEQSSLLQPDNPQYLYTYLLALEATGETEQAINKLQKLITQYSNNQQLIKLGLYFAQKTQNQNLYNWFKALE